MKKFLNNVNMTLFVVSVAVFAMGLREMADLHGDDGKYIECAGELGSDERRKCDMKQAAAWLIVLAGAFGILGSVGVKPFRELGKLF